MATQTDAARELVDLCALLSEGSQNQRGDEVVAAALGLAPWSTEFFQIVFTISKRIDQLVSIVAGLPMDDDYKEDAVRHLRTIALTFSAHGLHSTWSHAIKQYLSPQHVNAVKMLSPMVRQVQPLPKLDEAERAELGVLADQLLEWLQEHQLAEQDFVRQILIEGLQQFRFRLDRVPWVGWGYTLASLREVIGAYMALQRGIVDPATAPDAEAVLRKTAAFIKSVYEKVHTAKEVIETGDFLLKAYVAASALGSLGSAATKLIGP